ncbi:MAG: tRNA (adenosine(37)-N6)-threonylcarbamoyltransferase complex dimerization subunit type 1 TsaB [Candidatus Binatia bacterium]|nr:tRNA (adenosine(37)-N6)-threonylcarbamoyltransferase complex dimerization subunit type 1 TsaB [Candidatus Binatia bacterium]
METATWLASVALSKDESVIAEWESLTRGQHAAVLLPAIRALLKDASVTLADIDAVAVSVGPGSFTGLRVGLSVAKGLAFARKIPVVAVPTLEALAYAALPAEEPILTVLDARKGEVYAAGYHPAGKVLQPWLPEVLLPFEELVSKVTHPCVVIGDAVEAYGALFRERLGDQVRVLPFPEWAPRARIVASLAGERLRQGHALGDPPEEPHYLRPAEAQVKQGRTA